MWWTGNSCCFIGFCGTFLVLSGPSGDLAGPTSGAIIILPWRTNQKVQGSSVAFILWFGSGTNNVHSWSTQDTQGRCSALKKKKFAQEVKKMKISGSCLCVRAQTCMCIHMYAGGSFLVSLCVSICQCIQLPLLMENVPGEKSPKFKVQVQISLWWCCLFGEVSKGWRGWGGAVARESKNQSGRLIRKDVWKTNKS